MLHLVLGLILSGAFPAIGTPSMISSPSRALSPRAAMDCYENSFCIESEQSGDSVHVYVRNLLAWEFTMKLDMDMENATADVPLPITRSFDARVKTRITSLVIDEPGERWAFSFDMKWMLGSMSARHARDVTYRLPYSRGREYLVGQGYKGGTTHQGIYAIDWDMPEGTEVRAARAGVVIDYQEDFWKGGLDEHLKSRGNFVKIRHGDGTIGNYVHLRRHGVRVEVGQHIRRGQVIAYSGNTGYTSGPHLHFEVYTVTPNLDRNTIPVAFEANDRGAIRLEEGRYYGH